MEKYIIGAILTVLTAACGLISLFQFRQKGFLFNNAYLFATKAEREAMDKSPHYRQSAIVFLLLAALWLCLLLRVMLNIRLFSWLGGVAGVAAMIYAIVSSVRIEKGG